MHPPLQSGWIDAPHGTLKLESLSLENGECIQDFQLSYAVHGNLEDQKLPVTIVLCAGRMAERRTVLPKASVDALSIGISTSTNCDPPSDAEAKRTIFIRVLRIARNWALVYLSG